MGLFGGTQLKTEEFNAECHSADSVDCSGGSVANKTKVIVSDDQKSRELRRIRTTRSAIYLFDLYDVVKHTWYSYLVTHRDANPARQGLTLLSGRDVVLSLW